ncbi:unnamed protein product [Symbiodinium sp. CCMP2456]|nr:unnamed protein product [Symbiodinium sp. CCMP2456]
MGNVTSACANPSTHHCCRWTAEDDAELSVEGRTRKSKTEEEPRLNFDTNVIGPTNANIIGGAGASPLQELKFLEERSFKKDWQREPTPERTSKDTQNRKAQTAELKKAAKALQPKAVAKGGFPVSAKAKPKSDVSMSSVSSSSILPFSSPGKSLLPQKEEKVVSPKTAEDRAAPAAKLKAELPEEPQKPVEGTEQSTAVPLPASPNPCKKLIPSLSPALWSPMHRRWTCQKALQPEPAQTAQTVQPSQPAESLQPAATATTDETETKAQVEEKPQRTPPVLSLCSPPPALWSPLHRKWCGAVLKMQLAQVPTLLVKKAAAVPNPKTLLSLESETLLEKTHTPELVDVKTQAEPEPPLPLALKAPAPAPASMPDLPARISFSSAPALYSKWHGRWTGCLPEPAKLGA